MIHIEVFTTLGQSVADATVIAQQQVNTWLEQHPYLSFEHLHIQTQVLREATDINWCIVTVSYEGPPAHTNQTL